MKKEALKIIETAKTQKIDKKSNSNKNNLKNLAQSPIWYGQ